jgi:hypothetical protein
MVGDKDKMKMGIHLSDNYVMVEILIHVDMTFFTQNKQMDNHPKFCRLFMEHLVQYRTGA